jgi:hypothetical protein
MAVIRKSGVIVIGLALVFAWGFSSPAHAQSAIAFVPGIGLIPSGATMTVTPAVSADRRYVRLTVEPFFNSLNGFTNFNVQGAVSGAGAFGAFGGFGGLNGVMAGVGMGGVPGGMSSGASIGQAGELLAGPVPFGDGPADLGAPLGDPLNPNVAAPSNTGGNVEGQADADGGLPDVAAGGAGDRLGVRAANRPHSRQRRATPRKSSRRHTTTPDRRSR